jgi:glycosyltransferase involved in cell wall biosynthesis
VLVPVCCTARGVLEASEAVVSTWLLVAGDFSPTGGMDMANLALARFLADRQETVHLVAHRAHEELAGRPNVIIHRVPRPLGSHWLGGPLLAWSGRKQAHQLVHCGARVVLNGGNCNWPDINWVHFVHAAFSPQVKGSVLRTLKNRLAHKQALATERACLLRSRVVICNSARTARDVVERIGVHEQRVRVVYYGTDPTRFRPVTESDRRAARLRLNWSLSRPVVAFVGALGDRRKGFDALFEAWRLLCQSPDWDCDLIVIGAGAELPSWKRRARDEHLGERIRFLGFCSDVAGVFSACDALIHPARYEAYGLAVHEALSCSLPALVSAEAGVAEMYPDDFRALLLTRPDDPNDLVNRLRGWRRELDAFKLKMVPFAQRLRARTWSCSSSRPSHAQLRR